MLSNINTQIVTPVIQIRQFTDGTWSVIARVWNPCKKFYEHPTLINLTEEEAKHHCNKLIKDVPCLNEILETWVYIGD